MAKFEGSFDEFKKYFGGYCRNKVNQITNPYKLQQNKKCLYCNKITELDAAHIKGFERITIMEKILNDNFKIMQNTYFVDLQKFEELFIKAHQPINEHFYFLCHSCHLKYDKGEISLDNSFLSKQSMTVSNLTNTQKSTSLISSQINDNDWYKKTTESIQKYIIRLLKKLETKNMLTSQLIHNLQNREYCKENFAINYPLLEPIYNNISPAGHARYYTTFTIANNYVCKEWWKQNFHIYELKLYKWVNMLLNSKIN